MRGVQDKYQEDFPIGSVATQFMTAAPTLAVNPLGAGANRTIAAVSPKAATWLNPATKLTGPVANATRAAISGAGYGAVSGAGESRAEDLSGVV
eukprot:16138-Eustigmatos_ZCMA.PRE.1